MEHFGIKIPNLGTYASGFRLFSSVSVMLNHAKWTPDNCKHIYPSEQFAYIIYFTKQTVLNTLCQNEGALWVLFVVWQHMLWPSVTS